jgi:hypothetical protein
MALLARLPLNRICASQLCVSVTGLIFKVRTSPSPQSTVSAGPSSDESGCPHFPSGETCQRSMTRRSEKKKKEENGVMKRTERFFGTCIFLLRPLVPFFLDFSACDACPKFATVFYCGQFLAADQPLTASYSPFLIRSGPRAKSRGLRTDGNKMMNTCC